MCIRTIGKPRNLKSFVASDVCYDIVSLSQRVQYQRFYCIIMKSICSILVFNVYSVVSLSQRVQYQRFYCTR